MESTPFDQFHKEMYQFWNWVDPCLANYVIVETILFVWLLIIWCCLGYGQDPKVTIRNTQPTTFLELQGRVNEKVINAVRVQDVTMSCYVEDLGPGMLVSLIFMFGDKKWEILNLALLI